MLTGILELACFVSASFAGYLADVISRKVGPLFAISVLMTSTQFPSGASSSVSALLYRRVQLMMSRTSTVGEHRCLITIALTKKLAASSLVWASEEYLLSSLCSTPN